MIYIFLSQSFLVIPFVQTVLLLDCLFKLCLISVGVAYRRELDCGKYYFNLPSYIKHLLPKVYSRTILDSSYSIIENSSRVFCGNTYTAVNLSV